MSTNSISNGNSIKEIFSKEYPYSRTIKGHSIFKSIKKIDKVFTDIGLANCEKEIVIDNLQEKKEAAKLLLFAIGSQISHRIIKLQSWGSSSKKKIKTASRKEKHEKCLAALSAIRLQVLETEQANVESSLFTESNGKFTLNLSKDVLDKNGKSVFKSKERLFGVYNKLNALLVDGKFLPMPKLEELPSFKAFSAKNIPADKANKLVVRFSSSGADGIWDIATMSMRGIKSCQTWGQSNATHVVGSMCDPFTGIIYLTNSNKTDVSVENKYGSKMIRRCIVRFVVNEKTKKPYLYLEKMYPAFDIPSLNAFKAFLFEKTADKFDIFSAHEDKTCAPLHSSYVPLSNVIRSLDPINRPYCDSAMPYKNDIFDAKAKFKDEIDVKLFSIYSMFINQCSIVINNLKLDKSATPLANSALAAMKNTTYNNYAYLYYTAISDMAKSMAQNQAVDYNKDNNLIMADFIRAYLASDLQGEIKKTIVKTMKRPVIPVQYRSYSVKLLDPVSTMVADSITTELKLLLTKYETSYKNYETKFGSVTTARKKRATTEVPGYVSYLN